jgi:hypothetical protein
VGDDDGVEVGKSKKEDALIPPHNRWIKHANPHNRQSGMQPQQKPQIDFHGRNLAIASGLNTI